MEKSTIVRQIGTTTAIALIIANMVGSGVFTTLGYQVLGINSVFAVLMIWIVGGVVALFGAFCYAELAMRYPRSGGEYNYLSKIYHPALGFLSGWVSATVGFAAPIGLSAMAFGGYISKVFPGLAEYQVWVSCGVILLVAGINLLGVQTTTVFQRFITGLNIFLIIVLIILGIFSGHHPQFSLTFGATDWKYILTRNFAVSLVYVSFAYSGWNSVTYIAGEMKDPRKSIPVSLVTATSVVMLMYVMLNFVFLYTVPIGQLAGQKEVGFLAGEAILGSEGGKWIAGIICLLLLASANSMMLSGPRVTHTIGEDIKFFSFFTKRTAGGSPLIATLTQTAIALLIVTARFDEVLTYIGFTLSLFTTLTVSGLVIARFRKAPEPGVYKTPWFPIPAIIFIALEVYSMSYTLLDKTRPSLLGLATVLTGLIIFYLTKGNFIEEKK